MARRAATKVNLSEYDVRREPRSGSWAVRQLEWGAMSRGRGWFGEGDSTGFVWANVGYLEQNGSKARLEVRWCGSKMVEEGTGWFVEEGRDVEKCE